MDVIKFYNLLIKWQKKLSGEIDKIVVNNPMSSGSGMKTTITSKPEEKPKEDVKHPDVNLNYIIEVYDNGHEVKHNPEYYTLVAKEIINWVFTKLEWHLNRHATEKEREQFKKYKKVVRNERQAR